MVGGGVLGNAETTKIHKEGQYIVRDMKSMATFNPNVKWVQNSVVSFQPDQNQITLKDGDEITYDYLVVNPGLKLRFDLIEGAREAMADPDSPVGSIY